MFLSCFTHCSTQANELNSLQTDVDSLQQQTTVPNKTCDHVCKLHKNMTLAGKLIWVVRSLRLLCGAAGCWLASTTSPHRMLSESSTLTEQQHLQTSVSVHTGCVRAQHWVQVTCALTALRAQHTITVVARTRKGGKWTWSVRMRFGSWMAWVKHEPV